MIFQHRLMVNITISHQKQLYDFSAIYRSISKDNVVLSGQKFNITIIPVTFVIGKVEFPNYI